MQTALPTVSGQWQARHHDSLTINCTLTLGDMLHLHGNLTMSRDEGSKFFLTPAKWIFDESYDSDLN